MWRYSRRWKPAFVLPLTLIAWLLITGRTGLATGQSLGMVIALLLGLLYVVEEVVWIAQNQGRPCLKCGAKLRLKPFSLWNRCPHCRELQ